MRSCKFRLVASVLLMGIAVQSHAQVNASDSVMSHAKGNRFSVGGYGEATFSRMYYSDNGNRYTTPSSYKKDPSHGRFDIPHAVIYLGYDFGKGWSMGSEIEFEHGGTGASIEYEADEAIEFEHETEKGGEVELEQFWIQKTFGRALNIKAGHIVVPLGLTNAHHEPLNFFTVYRPEGENTILPCTWHQTGISVWGRTGDFRYEAQMVAGLDAYHFSRSNWIQGGSSTPFEFEVANKYGFLLRVDNSIPFPDCASESAVMRANPCITTYHMTVNEARKRRSRATFTWEVWTLPTTVTTGLLEETPIMAMSAMQTRYPN